MKKKLYFECLNWNFFFVSIKWCHLWWMKSTKRKKNNTDTNNHKRIFHHHNHHHHHHSFNSWMVELTTKTCCPEFKIILPDVSLCFFLFYIYFGVSTSYIDKKKFIMNSMTPCFIHLCQMSKYYGHGPWYSASNTFLFIYVL